MTAPETNGHKAEFGMTGTTFTGDSTTLRREAYLESLGLPDEKASGELVRRLIKNVISIKDETGASAVFALRRKVLRAGRWTSERDQPSRKLTELALLPIRHPFAGEFLLHLPGGKVVDTKSWMEGWEWTHGSVFASSVTPSGLDADAAALRRSPSLRSVGLYGAAPSSNSRPPPPSRHH